MRILLFASFVISLYVIPAYAINDSTDWCNTANCDVTWNYRKKITIDYTKVGTDDSSGYVTNFPILINFTGTHFTDLKNSAESDGKDLRFTDYTGNDLDWEIEQFDTTNDKMAVWVQANSTGISKSTNTILYVYYRNPVDDEGVKFGVSASSNSNEPSVWDSSYTGVWHLDDTSFGNNSVDDSTNNGNLDAPTSSWSSSDSVYGISSRGINFDGTKEMSDGQAKTMYNSNGLAVEAWVKPDNVSVCKTVASAYKEQNNKKGWHMGVGCTSGKIYATISTDGTTTTTYTGSNTISAGSWQHIAITHDGTDFKLYHNGTLDQSASVSTINVPTGISVHVGATFDGDNLYDGILDELRISNAARSYDYIKTTYNNVASPDTFYSIGTQDDGAPEIPVINDIKLEPHHYAAKIFWDAISDSGASALSYYRILTVNIFPLHELNYTSIQDSANPTTYYEFTDCATPSTFYIRAVNPVRASAPSNTVSITTEDCEGNSDPPNILGIGIYDHPTNYYYSPDVADPNYFFFEEYAKGHTTTVPTDTVISIATRVGYENGIDDIASYGIYLNNRDYYASKESGGTSIHWVNTGIHESHDEDPNHEDLESPTITIVDEHDYFESVRYSNVRNDDEKWLVFNVVFKKPMKESHVIIDIWDEDRNSRVFTLNGLEVVQKETELDRHMPYEITMLDTNLDTCIEQCYQSLEVSTNDNQVTWKNIDDIFHNVAVTVPDVDGYYTFANLEIGDSLADTLQKKRHLAS